MAVLRRAALGAALAAAAAAAQGATATAEPLARLETGMHTAVIMRVATDSAGRWAVTASQDRTARVWEVATGRLAGVLRPPQDDDNEGKLFAAAMSPDGQVVAVAGRTQLGSTTGHTIYLFDRAAGKLLRRIQGLPDPVFHLAYSPDGRWLAASMQGKGGLRLFDAASGAERGRDTTLGDNAYSVQFSGDSKRLASTSYDGQLRVHAVDPQGALQLVRAAQVAGGKRPYAARFSPDGRLIAVGFDDSAAVQVLDAESLAEVARPTTAQVTQGNLSRVAWSADGRFLLAGGTWVAGGGNAVRRWSVQDWSRYQDIVVSRNTVSDLATLPRRPAAAGSSARTIRAGACWTRRRACSAGRIRPSATSATSSSGCRCRTTAAACASAPRAAARRCSRSTSPRARSAPTPLPCPPRAPRRPASPSPIGAAKPSRSSTQRSSCWIATSPRAASPSPRTAGASWWARSGTCGSSRGRARRAGVGPWRAPCGR